MVSACFDLRIVVGLSAKRAAGSRPAFFASTSSRKDSSFHPCATLVPLIALVLLFSVIAASLPFGSSPDMWRQRVFRGLHKRRAPQRSASVFNPIRHF